MATPAGYIDTNSDAFWIVDDAYSTGPYKIVIPIFWPPQYSVWKTSNPKTRQQLTVNPNMKISRVGANVSTIQWDVVLPDVDETDTRNTALDFGYDYNSSFNDFVDMETAPNDDMTIQRDIFGPSDGNPETRMEYRDVKLKFDNNSWHGSDTEREHVFSGAHFALEHDVAYGGDNFELIGSDGTWHPYDEQRFISAFQAKYYLCNNLNKVAYASSPNFSMPFIGYQLLVP